MQSKFTKQENNNGLLELTFTPEELKAVLPKAFNRSKNHFRVNGFRKGKAPMHIVLQMYGEQVLYEDAINILLDDNMQAAIKEHGLELVDRPELEVEAIGSDKDTVLKLKVTLLPEFELPKYIGVEAVMPASEIGDDKVQAELQRVQARSARTVPVEDRPVQTGDIVNIDYCGKVDDVEFEGGSAEKQDLEIGSDSFIPGFEDQLIGKNIGESFDINVKFPEQYHAENLAGKDAVFSIVLHSIKAKELPVLDDEFAKDVSEFDTLQEYKDSLRDNLQKQAESRAKSEFENNVLKNIVDNAQFEVPAVMVESEIDAMVRQQARQFEMQGIKLEQILQYSGSDLQTYRESMREAATIHVKSEIVLKAIAKKENMQLSDAEKEEEIADLAKRYGMSVEDIKRQIGDNADEILQGSLLRKVVDFLVEKAIKIAPTEEIKL